MARFLISGSDPHIRQHLIVHAHEPGKVHLQTEYDAEPPLAQARLLRDMAHAAKSRRKDVKILGVLPRTVWVQAMREGWDDEKIKQYFRDNDNLRVDR